MAEKKKAAPKQADPVESVSATRDPESGDLTLEVNGTKHPISEQDLLALRREVNDLAAGFVH